MKKSILLPTATFLASVVLFFLRKSQLAQVKDPITFLYTANASQTMLLMVVLFGCILGLSAFLLSGGRVLPNYTYTTYCPHPLFMTTVVTGSFFILLSFVVGLMDIKNQQDALGSAFTFPLLNFVNMILVALVGFVMMYLGKLAYRGNFLKECWLTTIPAYCGCARLLITYRTYGSMTNIQDSFYPVVGALCLTLALYHLCATAYLEARPRIIIFFSLVSVLFTGIIVASEVPLYDILLTAGFNLYMLAFSGAILENTYASREQYRTPPPEGESEQENHS